MRRFMGPERQELHRHGGGSGQTAKLGKAYIADFEV